MQLRAVILHSDSNVQSARHRRSPVPSDVSQDTSEPGLHASSGSSHLCSPVRGSHALSRPHPDVPHLSPSRPGHTRMVIVHSE